MPRPPLFDHFSRSRWSRKAQLARRDDPKNWAWMMTSYDRDGLPVESRSADTPMVQPHGGSITTWGKYLGPHTDFLWEYIERCDRRLFKLDTYRLP